MGETTGITWTDHTFNAWWGCVRVSEACRHCYAEAMDKRVGGNHWGPNADRHFFGDKHWNEPRRWNRLAEVAGQRARVFCSSMADVFERHRRDDVNEQMNAARARLCRLIEETPWLDWQLLTKRPENIGEMLPQRWLDAPRPNVWLGTTAEGQTEMDLRVPELTKVSAAVHFVSAEPLLGPVTLEGLPHLDWLIVGGESGSEPRRMAPSWALTLRSEAREMGTAFFFKQAGSALGREWKCRHPPGADPAEWPPEFRVQQFPATAVTGPEQPWLPL